MYNYGEVIKMNQYKKELLAAYSYYYKKQPGHTYSLLVVKVELMDCYNFFINDQHGANFMYDLTSIPFADVTLYKDTLRALLQETNLPIEYRGFG